MKIELGKKYTHALHKIKGVCVCHSKHITGCDRVCLEYVQGGQVYEIWIDVNNLKEFKDKTKKLVGGPQPTPPVKRSR